MMEPLSRYELYRPEKVVFRMSGGYLGAPPPILRW